MVSWQCLMNDGSVWALTSLYRRGLGSVDVYYVSASSLYTVYVLYVGAVSYVLYDTPYHSPASHQPSFICNSHIKQTMSQL